MSIGEEPIAHVMAEELNEALDRAELSVTEFNELFGVQTCPLINGQHGLYPWDVEAVLERMISGKLTGTQAFWD